MLGMWLGGAYYAGARINRSAQGVDGNDMRRLLIPWPVLLPITCRDFLPRVVEIDGLLEVLHCEVVCVVVCRWVGRVDKVCGCVAQVRRSS